MMSGWSDSEVQSSHRILAKEREKVERKRREMRRKTREEMEDGC